MRSAHGAMLPLAQLLEQLHASEYGLTQDEAQQRLLQGGPNEPVVHRHSHGMWPLLTFATNPLVVMLLLASLVSGILHDIINAIIIALIVLLSVVLNVVQTFRSQQAALTEESMPAEKDAGDLAVAPPQLAEARHMVFLGTSVVSGTAQALVVATGPATAFGDIAVHLSMPPPETEFERGTRHFALLIMRTVLFVVLFVVLASLTLRHPPIESLLFAVALAVGLTPEFLPMIMQVTLAQGAVHMARQQVIVKHLAAIEDFGSMDVLCSDKTGTLTTGTMVLERCLDPVGRPVERPLVLRRTQQPV
jgi:Mg2+-importing ATPase